MRIQDMVSLTQYRKIEELASSRLKTVNEMKSTLIKAKGILDAPLTKANITNAVITLESLPSRDFMRKSISKWIVRSAKSPNSYCEMVKKKCEATGRAYNGLNRTFSTFNNLPDWFVYETFKERAIKTVPGSFSLRFRDALVAFILDQQKFVERNPNSDYRR